MEMLQQLGDKPLVGMDLNDLQTWLGSNEPSYRARQLYDAVYRKQVANLSAVSNLPKNLRERLAGGALGLPESERRYQSGDGTVRYLLRLQDNRSVEAVLMPETARHTICISSQVGCPVDCKFCLTALMGLERNLTAGEIVGQVMHVVRENHLVSGASLNVVMMGMGEPLLNLDNVLKATRLLTDPDGFAMSPKRITISTSGIVPKMAELGAHQIRPKLAVSLNASTEEQRRRLMPITRKYPLAQLMQACRDYPLRSWEKLTFEYVLLKDVNDSDADAHRVVRLVSQINCKVNLIALNPGPGIAFGTPDAARVLSFQAIVKKSVPCYIRKPRGLDIHAACGQLKRVASDFVTVETETPDRASANR